MDREKIIKELRKLDDSELLSLYREFLEAKQYFDDEIYDMDEFDEIMGNETPWDITRKCFYGDFCPNHAYFKFNGYGGLISTDYLTEWIDLDNLIEWLIDTDHEFLEGIE